MSTSDRRQPTIFQTINKIIPLMILGFTGWMALSTIESKMDRVSINLKLNNIVEQNVIMSNSIEEVKFQQEEVKESLEQHNRTTEMARIKVSTMHHQKGILLCDRCHDGKGRK